ncbi:MAG TPA: AAA family ATPase [Acidimicrobiales bacterium]|nr:AAA family ATPase [Acidimicrobiales bacterium]
MTDTRVYKFKRPVRFPFVDLRSVDDRAWACQQEVLLNSRLSPDVYEGVGSVVHPDGTAEPMVVMRHLPDALRLSALLADDDPHLEGHIDSLATLIAHFHQGVVRDDSAARFGAPEEVMARWTSNLSELREVARGKLEIATIDELDALGRRFLSGRSQLLRSRAKDGHVLEGHGDLLADDVFCLDDGPRVLDCLEFDFALRCVDVACEIASLAMDVERLGRPDMADRFEARYKEVSGQAWPRSLFAFYRAYRGAVRAKVALIRAGQGDGAGRPEAERLLSLARAGLAEERIRLVLVGGLPGSGKSTLATDLAELTGWDVLRSDEVRRALVAHAGSATSFGSGAYDAEAVAGVYAELLERAGAAMKMGRSVILDASWYRRDWREAARRLAIDGAADTVELRCAVPMETAIMRISDRLREGRGLSEATPEVALRMAELSDPWPEAHTIDTTAPPMVAARAAARVVSAAPDN